MEKENKMILKSQASVEVLKVNHNLKRLSVLSIVGALFIYGVNVTYPKVSILFAGALCLVSTYFFFIAHQKEKYLLKTYDIKIDTERFKP